MKLAIFKSKVQTYCRNNGFSQKELAAHLGLHPVVLSRKLSQSGPGQLTHFEVRQIIKILAGWRTLNQQSEVAALLDLMDLKPNTFTPQEWASPPLKELEADIKIAGPDFNKADRAFTQPRAPAPELSLTQNQLKSPLEFISYRNKSNSRPPNNIPAQPTPLVGRTQEIREITGLIHRADIRLLTLSGPGGVGKTRLALHLAAVLIEDFTDGVFWVSLANLTDPSLLPQTLANTLDLKDAPGQSNSLESLLLSFLAGKKMLLVLDNFEFITSAGAFVKTLLAAAPALKVLITSQVVLRLYGEHCYIVPPLPVPDLKEAQTAAAACDVARLNHNPAFELFIQRARSFDAQLKLNPENLLAIAQICVRLDGLPLAIELAAARVRLFSPKSLFARLTGAAGSTPLSLLNKGASDLPQRHQTMREAIAWSYSGLEKTEREVFAQLGVFIGGWSVEGAEKICLNPDDIGLNPPSTRLLDTLESLLDKSMLLRSETDEGEVRFDMLQMLREFARERLEQSGLGASLRYQHALFFLNLAEEARPQLLGPKAVLWLERLEREQANMRAALSWALTEPSLEIEKIELGLRMCIGLYRFWEIRGYISEGRRWIEQVLNACRDPNRPGSWLANLRDLRLVGTVLNEAGNFAHMQDDFTAAEAAYEACLQVHQSLDNSKGVASALNSLGNTALSRCDYPAAAGYYSQSQNIFHQTGPKLSEAATLTNLATAYFKMGSYEPALSLYES